MTSMLNCRRIGRKAIRRGEFIRFLSNFIFEKKDMIYIGAQTGDYEVLMWSVSVKPNEFTILYEMWTSSRLMLFLLVRLRFVFHSFLCIHVFVCMAEKIATLCV